MEFVQLRKLPGILTVFDTGFLHEAARISTAAYCITHRGNVRSVLLFSIKKQKTTIHLVYSSSLGDGSSLMRALLTDTEVGITGMILTVDSADADRFYQKFGFVRAGQTLGLTRSGRRLKSIDYLGMTRLTMTKTMP